jgi:myo-inositol-1(or 4)-monophosphatase
MNWSAWSLLAHDIKAITQPIFTHAGLGFQQSTRKDDGSLLTETDLALNKACVDYLLQQYPDIPVLSEEMDEEAQNRQLATGSCWLLDPLDGTSNFTHGIPIFSVSLALMMDGKIVAGMVYDPNRHELFTAIDGLGARLNDQALHLEPNAVLSLKHAMAVIDTKRLNDKLSAAIATQHPYHSQRSFGSVALDWCWLSCGRIQTYLHGKQKLWDFSAGALIAQESGALASTLEGHSILQTPITLTARSAVGACPSLAKAWPEWIAQQC